MNVTPFDFVDRILKLLDSLVLEQVSQLGGFFSASAACHLANRFSLALTITQELNNQHDYVCELQNHKTGTSLHRCFPEIPPKCADFIDAIQVRWSNVLRVSMLPMEYKPVAESGFRRYFNLIDRARIRMLGIYCDAPLDDLFSWRPKTEWNGLEFCFHHRSEQVLQLLRDSINSKTLKNVRFIEFPFTKEEFAEFKPLLLALFVQQQFTRLELPDDINVGFGDIKCDFLQRWHGDPSLFRGKMLRLHDRIDLAVGEWEPVNSRDFLNDIFGLKQFQLTEKPDLRITVVFKRAHPSDASRAMYAVLYLFSLHHFKDCNDWKLFTKNISHILRAHAEVSTEPKCFLDITEYYFL